LRRQVKDRTIDQLAAALEAREEALERHASTAKSMQARPAENTLPRLTGTLRF
jgi:hypothetical protein